MTPATTGSLYHIQHIFPFCRYVNWGSHRLNNSSKVIQLLSDRTKIEISFAWFLSNSFFFPVPVATLWDSGLLPFTGHVLLSTQWYSEHCGIRSSTIHHKAESYGQGGLHQDPSRSEWRTGPHERHLGERSGMFSEGPPCPGPKECSPLGGLG